MAIFIFNTFFTFLYFLNKRTINLTKLHYYSILIKNCYKYVKGWEFIEYSHNIILFLLIYVNLITCCISFEKFVSPL